MAAPALFHCQQAAEESFKAFLTSKGIAFRTTHDLEEVGAACTAIDPSLAGLAKAAEPLTVYAWKFRYPGEPFPAELEEAEAASGTARTVCEGIMAHLPESERA